MSAKSGPYSAAWRRYKNTRGLMQLLLLTGWLAPLALWNVSHGLGVVSGIILGGAGFGLFVKAVSFPCPRCGKELGPMKRGFEQAPLWRRPGSEPLFGR